MPEKYTILSDLHTGGLWRIMLYLFGEIEEGNKIIIPGIDSDRVDNLDMLRYLQKYHFRNVFMTAGNHEEGFVKTMYEFYNFIAFSNIEYSSPMLQLNMADVNWLNSYFSEDNAEWYLDIVKKEIEKQDELTLEKLIYSFGRVGKVPFNFTETFKKIINSPSYLFIDDLVRKAERECAEEKFPAIEIKGRKVMIFHGVPLDFERNDVAKGYNSYLWSGLTKGSRKNKKTIQKSFDPMKAFSVFDYLDKYGYKGLIRGHDHMPTFITRKKIDEGYLMNVYTLYGSFMYYYGQKEQKVLQFNSIPINKRKRRLKAEDDELFIFSPGAFEDGYYGNLIASSRKGFKFRVYHTKQDNAPHKNYPIKDMRDLMDFLP